MISIFVKSVILEGSMPYCYPMMINDVNLRKLTDC